MMTEFALYLMDKMGHMSCYIMNLVLVALLSVSAAGSIFYLCARLSAGILRERHGASGLYVLMRASVLFFLLPAVLLAAGTAYVRARPEWGILETLGGEGTLDVISHERYSGFLMIWNPKLSTARLLAFAAWLCGFAAVFLFQAVRGRASLKKIRAASAEWKDAPVLEACAALCRELGIRKSIRIYRCSLIACPFSAGILHPAVFFPAGMTCGENLLFTLKHELVHCRRKDVACRLLMMLVRGIHWYNPFIGFLERDFFHCSEMACDEKVLEHADSKERYRYAKLLLEMMEEEKEERILKIKTGFTGRNEKEAEERMVHIMKGTGKAAGHAAAWMAACAALLCPAVTFAASQAVCSADSYIARKAEEEISVVEEMNIPVYAEHMEHRELTQEDILDFERLRLIGKGSTNISVSLSDSSAKNLLAVSLSKGECVRVSLCSGSRQDSFVAGIKDAEGVQTYIYSADGSVMHDFYIGKTSDYIVFVRKIKAADGRKIQINGNVNIYN